MTVTTILKVSYLCDRCGKIEESALLLGQDASPSGAWPSGWCWIKDDDVMPNILDHACAECAAKMESVGTEFVSDHPASRSHLALVQDVA